MTKRRNERVEQRKRRDLAEIPAAKGAYALILELPAEIAVPFAGGKRLPPGRYVYAGSAYGPGGLKARISRHLRTGKPTRWHIDHLRPEDHAIAVIGVIGGGECSLAQAAANIRGASIPLRKFGASDCAGCAAHLIQVPDTTGADAIARRYRSAIVIDRAGTTSLRRSLRPTSR